MTPKRAREILDSMSPFGAMDYTEEEHREITAVWDTMPGHTCFFDAVVRIAKGEPAYLEQTGVNRFRLHLKH